MKTRLPIVKVAALALLLFGVTACKSYIHFRYGISQPREETSEKLFSFLEKHHFPDKNIFVFSDSASFGNTIRSSVYGKYLLSHMIFNRQGKLLQQDTTQCQWSGYEMVKSLDPDSTYETSDALQLEQIIQRIHPLENHMVPDNMLKEPDFTLVVTWAKFLGAYNSRLFVLNDAVKQNKKARIRLIWLNVDMLKCWKLTSRQKMAIK